MTASTGDARPHVAPLSRRWLPILASGIGACILASGDARFTSAALSTPRAVAPWWVWGFLFLAAGMALASVNDTHRWWVLLAVAFPYGLFSISQVGSFLDNPTAAGTGIVTYGWIACWHLRLSAEEHAIRKVP